MKFEYLFIILFVIGCSSQKTIEKHGGLSFKVSISKPEKAEQTLEIINQRITDLGVYTTITSDGTKRNYLIEIPGESDTTLFERLICSKGKFEILEAYKYSDVNYAIEEIDEIIKLNEIKGFEPNDTFNSIPISSKYSIHNVLMENEIEFPGSNKAAIGSCLVEDTTKINYLLKMDFVKMRLPRGANSYWGIYMFRDEVCELYLTNNRTGSSLIDNKMIEEAYEFKDEFDFEVIQVNLKKEFHDHWSRMTRNNRMKYLAIILDNEVVFAPEINSEITNGSFNLSGNFSKSEAQMLAAFLNSNFLDADVKIQSVTYTNI